MLKLQWFKKLEGTSGVEAQTRAGRPIKTKDGFQVKQAYMVLKIM